MKNKYTLDHPKVIASIDEHVDLLMGLKVVAEFNESNFQNPIYFRGETGTTSKNTSMEKGRGYNKDLIKVFNGISPVKEDGSQVTILDHGAGSHGRNSKVLRNMGFKVYGYDKYHSTGADPWSGVSMKLPPNDMKFDYVISVFVLNVVPKSDEKEIVNQITKYSKNVILLVRAANSGDLYQPITRAFKNQSGPTFKWIRDEYLPARGVSFEDLYDEEGNVPDIVKYDIARYGFLTTKGFQRLTFPETFGFTRFKKNMYIKGSI